MRSAAITSLIALKALDRLTSVSHEALPAAVNVLHDVDCLDWQLQVDIAATAYREAV